MTSAEPICETARLVLRDFQADDVHHIVGFFAEPGLKDQILRRQRSSANMSAYVKLVVEHAEKVHWSSRLHLHFAIVLRDTHELIGTCNLSDATLGSRRARIGWHLAGRFKGFGYATEVASTLLDIAFLDRKVARVIADCFASNAANIRVLENVGMSRVWGQRFAHWLIALTYFEAKPIVRYEMKNESNMGFRANAA